MEQLIEATRTHGIEFALEELQNAVADNDKKRFSFSEDGLSIKANQGHSIKVELEYAPVAPPEVLYHGTAERFLTSIKQQGLIKGKRHHVHLSANGVWLTERVPVQYLMS